MMCAFGLETMPHLLRTAIMLRALRFLAPLVLVLGGLAWVATLTVDAEVRTWTRAFIFMALAVFALAAAVLTLFMSRWLLRRWVMAARRGRGRTESPELQPLLAEV